MTLTDFYSQDDLPFATKNLKLCQCGLIGQVPSPRWLRLHCWFTCPALLALKVLLNNKQIYQILWNVSKTVKVYVLSSSKCQLVMLQSTWLVILSVMSKVFRIVAFDKYIEIEHPIKTLNNQKFSNVYIIHIDHLPPPVLWNVGLILCVFNFLSSYLLEKTLQTIQRLSVSLLNKSWLYKL